MMTPLRVLVVEDNALNRRLVQAVLERREHIVIEAGTVEEARERLREGRPDVAILDIHIPGGGGEVLLAEIRANPALASLPCIAVTASAMQGDRERFLAAGFDGYLSKPIDTKTFCDDVEAFAAGRGR